MLPSLANLSLRRQGLAVGAPLSDEVKVAIVKDAMLKIQQGAPLSDEVKAAMLEIECNICFEKIKEPSPSWRGDSTDAGAKEWTVACFNQHVFHKACLKRAWNEAGSGNERCPDCRAPPAQGLLAQSTGWLGAPSTPGPERPAVYRMLRQRSEDDRQRSRGMRMRVDSALQAAEHYSPAWHTPLGDNLGGHDLRPPLPIDTARVHGEVETQLAAIRSLLTEDDVQIDREARLAFEVRLALEARLEEIGHMQQTVLQNRINYTILGTLILILDQYVSGLRPVGQSDVTDVGLPATALRVQEIKDAYMEMARQAGLSWDVSEERFRANNMARLLDGSPLITPAPAPAARRVDYGVARAMAGAVTTSWGQFQVAQRAVTDETKERLRRAAGGQVQPFDTFVEALTAINRLWGEVVEADREDILDALNAFYDREVALERVARSASAVFNVSGNLSDTTVYANSYLHNLNEAWPRFSEANRTVNEERRSANRARARIRLFGGP